MRHLNYKTPKFLGDFSSMTSTQVREWMVEEFQVSAPEVEKYQILAGCLEEGGYESEVWLLLQNRETGGLFEVHASHCSCYGYEGEFKPEPTTLEYLKSDKFGISGLSGFGPYFVEFFKTI